MQKGKTPQGKKVKIHAGSPSGAATRKIDRRRSSAQSHAKSAASAPPLSRKERRRRARHCWWALPVSAALVCVLGAIALYWAGEFRAYASFLQKRQAVERATFYEGLTLEGVPLADMTLAQAQNYWQALDEQEKSAYYVTLRFEDRVWKLDPDDFGYSSDYREILSTAWAVGRYGSLEERYAEVTRAAGEWRRDYRIERGIDRKALRAQLSQIAAGLSVPGSDATVSGFDAQTLSFQFDEGVRGLEVDADQLLESVLNAVETGEDTVEIVRRQVDPPHTAAQLARQYGQISGAVTNASSSSKNRLTNLKMACRALNGVRVMPGETFSFNGTLGKRTTEKGYKPAGALENGRSTQEVGGGICQVSTTLFNAVAKADLAVTVRSPHSRPSDYVDIGKDAAVDWPSQDFQFKNNTDQPIYIAAELNSKKRVTVSIYGKLRTDGVTIKVASEVVETIPAPADRVSYDANLLPGERVVDERARKGYRAIAYKEYYDANGQRIKRVTLCKSSYSAAGAIVRVGA